MIRDCVQNVTDAVFLISATTSAWKVKNVLLKNSLKRFENAIMPDIVEVDNQRYEIPNEWKLKQSLLT